MLAPISGTRKDGRSSFRALKNYLAQERDEQTGEIRARGEMVLSDNLLSPETAAAEMRGVANENTRVKDPVYHYQLCWQPGERPTQEQWQSAAKKSIQSLGFHEHQYILGAHSDTEHFHVHVMVNRVHPETYRAHYPQFSKRSLDKTLREIEAEQGWRHSHGLYRWDENLQRAVQNTPEQMREQRESAKGDQASSRASKVQEYTDTETLEVYARGSPAKDLDGALQRRDATWNEVHALLRHYGLELEKGERGGYTVRGIGSDIRVKASKVFRNQFAGKLNRVRLAEKLGDYRAPEQILQARKPQFEYAARPLKRDPQERFERREQRAKERQQLRVRYRTYKAEATAARAVHLSDGQERMQRLRNEQAARRAEVKTLKISPTQRRAMRSVLAAESVQEREMLREQLKQEGAAMKVHTYREWVEDRAQSGDIAAARQLRGFLYRDKRAVRERDRSAEETPSIEGANRKKYDPVFHAIAKMQWEVNRRTGNVTYKLDGKDSFIDSGQKLRLLDNREATLVASLKVAQQKFGGLLHVTGTDQEKSEVALAAVKHGLKVRFTDKKINERLNLSQRGWPHRNRGLDR
jgi:hypothetical protein